MKDPIKLALIDLAVLQFKIEELLELDRQRGGNCRQFSMTVEAELLQALDIVGIGLLDLDDEFSVLESTVLKPSKSGSTKSRRKVLNNELCPEDVSLDRRGMRLKRRLIASIAE